jgi:hypothetical protein
MQDKILKNNEIQAILKLGETGAMWEIFFSLRFHFNKNNNFEK